MIYDAVLEAARTRVTGRPRLTDPRTAYGRCVIESAALVHKFGADSHVGMVYARGLNYNGRTHAAVVIRTGSEPADWQVIDPTARQFDANAPAPWTGTLADWYDSAVDWLGDHLFIEVYDADEACAQGVADYPCWTDIYDSRDDVDPMGHVTYAEAVFA